LKVHLYAIVSHLIFNCLDITVLVFVDILLLFITQCEIFQHVHGWSVITDKHMYHTGQRCVHLLEL